MSLVGNLKDLGLAEILQIVSLSRKSGVLGIKSSDREARIVFCQGKVVKAVSTDYPAELSHLLLEKGLVDHATLESSRSLQKDEGYTRRLGDILVQQQGLAADALESTVREVVENTLYSLFSWDEGTFDFDLQDNLDTVDDIVTDPLQYLLESGLNAQFLAMEGSRILDEQRHAVAGSGGGGAATDENVDFAFDQMKEPCSISVEQETVTPEEVRTPSEAELILVDDDDETRGIVSAFLQNHDYSVESFARGEDALIALDTLCRQGGTPVLLIDLIMPRMDGSGLLGGLELLELVNANFPGLQVLAMTDRHDVKAERAIAGMGYPLIVKPSRNAILAESAMAGFGERLLSALPVLKPGTANGGTDTVNIGDELRREMGEEAVPAALVAQSTGISLLRGMLEELNDPALGGGIILLVLRFASEFVSRAVIFSVKGREIVGLGQFGIDDSEQPGDMRVRAMRVPLAEKTIFSEVVESQLPVKLQMDDSRWCRYLREQLGGNPSEAFLGPIVSEGRVVAILYGDNGSDSRPIGDTDSLEIFLSQAGIAMEKALLQSRLKEKHLEGM